MVEIIVLPSWQAHAYSGPFVFVHGISACTSKNMLARGALANLFPYRHRAKELAVNRSSPG